MIRQYELVERVKGYDPGADDALLNRAYVFAMNAHGKQMRASGDPYFSHPLEVAGILTGMRLDCDTIITALLHDVVEDTLANIEEIEELFGPKIAELVDGVTKLSKTEIQTESLREAENFRKFLVAMAQDIRVLLVKLADRLHNMRTLHYIKREEKRRRIAQETMDIYAPLAGRIGIQKMKEELEELAFQQLDPEAMETITARLHYLIKQNPHFEADIAGELKRLTDDADIDARISSRIKRPYSIWAKMQQKQLGFEQISDVLAFRVIVPEAADCYTALGAIHRSFQMIPERFKDYISLPKPNLYRSLHTTVMGPQKQRLEIQIRTPEMHEEAELGVAAHWQYKQKDSGVEGSQYRFIQDLLSILETADSAEDFLEHTKLNMYVDKVFCFTPKGRLIALPKGSTPIDFAYAVHTQIGDHCTGAKVNGRLVPLRTALQNGDQIEILTEDDAAPNPRWENFVVTGRARSSIRRFIRTQRYAEFREVGQKLIQQACKRSGLDYSPLLMEEIAAMLGMSGADDMFASVGDGSITEDQVLTAGYPGFAEDQRGKRLPRVHGERNASLPVLVRGGGSQTVLKLAECCHPVRGDRIVGIHTPGRGVEIHVISCPRLGADDGETWLDMAWQEPSEEDDAFYVGQLTLEVINEIGALASIAATVAKAGANISNLQMTTRDPEFYIMVVDVDVRNLKHLVDVQRRLRSMRVISSAERILDRATV